MTKKFQFLPRKRAPIFTQANSLAMDVVKQYGKNEALELLTNALIKALRHYGYSSEQLCEFFYGMGDAGVAAIQSAKDESET